VIIELFSHLLRKIGNEFIKLSYSMKSSLSSKMQMPLLPIKAKDSLADMRDQIWIAIKLNSYCHNMKRYMMTLWLFSLIH